MLRIGGMLARRFVHPAVEFVNLRCPSSFSTACFPPRSGPGILTVPMVTFASGSDRE